MTAVEFAIEAYEKFINSENGSGGRYFHEQLVKDIEQAKAMEKEQKIHAYCEGFKISAEGWNGEYGIKDFNNLKEEIEAEKFYNETYGRN